MKRLRIRIAKAGEFDPDLQTMIDMMVKLPRGSKERTQLVKQIVDIFPEKDFFHPRGNEVSISTVQEYEALCRQYGIRPSTLDELKKSEYPFEQASFNLKEWLNEKTREERVFFVLGSAWWRNAKESHQTQKLISVLEKAKKDMARLGAQVINIKETPKRPGKGPGIEFILVNSDPNKLNDVMHVIADAIEGRWFGLYGSPEKQEQGIETNTREFVIRPSKDGKHPGYFRYHY